MVDYTTWRTTSEYSVTDLQLDKYNPRIPGELIEDASQIDIIQIMVERYNILPLAESISKNGFEPRELMIVVEEKGRPIVVEGNRRLAALKLLINPDLASIRERHKYQDLNSQIELDAIMNPNVIVAPSREAADPILLNKHTTNTEIPWKPLMQSFFYERKVKEYSSLTLDQVAAKLNIEKDLIDNALLRLDLYNRLLLLVSSDVKQYVDNQEKFDITTLERFTNTTSVRKMLKVSVTDNKFVPENPDYFDFIVKCLVEWMFKGPGGRLEKITSRTANTVDQMRKYILEAKSQYRTVKNLESPETEDASEDNEGVCAAPPDNLPFTSTAQSPELYKTVEVKGQIPSPPKKKKTRKLLFEENQFSYTVKGRANAKLLTEMQSILIDKAPNISAIVFRVFLERIIRQFLANNNIRSIEISDSTREGGKKKVRLGDARFGDIIDYITKKEFDIIEDDDVKKALRTFKGSDTSKPGSLCNLNNIVHYQGKIFSKLDIFELVDSLESTVDYFITNPSQVSIFAPQDDNTEFEG